MANFMVFFRDNNNSDQTAHTYMENTIVNAESEEEALEKFYAEAAADGANLTHRSIDWLPY